MLLNSDKGCGECAKTRRHGNVIPHILDMPQLDKLTFSSIVYGITILYIVQYLLASATYLFHFVSYMKVPVIRKTYAVRVAQILRQRIVVLLNNPTIEIPRSGRVLK